MAPDATDRFPDLTISFGRADTPDPRCLEYPDMLHAKFTAPHARQPAMGAYESGASILVLPAAYEDYWEGVGYYTRRKVRKALKEGYGFEQIDRDRYVDDIYAINTSRDVRQGRDMAEAYRRRPGPFGPLPESTCPRHQIRTYGVLRDGRLCAYSWVYQTGEMCLFSTILGHGDHLNAGVMYLLVAEALRDLIEHAGTKFAMYNMHFSGTEGLRFFKEQMGFQPYRVLWLRGDEAPEAVARMETERAAQTAPLPASSAGRDTATAARRPGLPRRVARRGRRLARSAIGAARGLLARMARAAR